MQETYTASIKKINMLKQVDKDSEESDVKRSISLKVAIEQIPMKISELNNDTIQELQIWQAISDLVKSQSALLLRCLPDFWRLSKAFIEGKFANKANGGATTTSPNFDPPSSRRRRVGMDMGKVEQCQRMTREIVNRYASLISEYFSLDEKQILAQKMADGSHRYAMPEFLPLNTNSVYVSEYLTLIISDLANCVNDINAINLAGEAFSGLASLMEETRSKFVDVVCKCWERGKLFIFIFIRISQFLLIVNDYLIFILNRCKDILHARRVDIGSSKRSNHYLIEEILRLS